MIEALMPNVYLKQLNFKAVPAVISSVQCVLSNGAQSPVYEKKNAAHQDAGSVNFTSEMSTKIRTV